MRSRKLAALICALAICVNYSARAQTPAQEGQKPNSPEQDEEKLVVGTNEVLLDAVVRDKKGHPVKDLQSSDFEVYEDGVRQDVKSFRLVTRDASNSPSNQTENNVAKSSNPATAPTKSTQGSVASVNRFGAIAMVFDRLPQEARTIARQAALSYLKDGLRPDDAVGVFRIDLSLKAVQRFTNNENLVRQGIDRALMHSPSTYTSATEQIGNLSDQQAALQDQLAQNTAGAGQGNDPSGSMAGTAADAQFAQMTQNILEGFERMEQSQQGYATTDGLLAIINEMSRLPGRKALIFFSVGVALPTRVMANYRSVISNANRANVSIYSVDAAGLRSTSADVAAGGALTKLGQARARVAASNADPFGSMMVDLERNEDLMRSNPEGALGDLAKETGGLLIANTNDPGSILQKVNEDLHSYYALSYTPTNQDYDGKFRQITIKVNRPGVEVQGRKGYYALDNSYGTPVLGYEAPALAILSGKPPPDAFPSLAAGFSFPEAARPGLVSVMVEVPANAISFLTDAAKKSYATNFSIVVLIKDEKQRVVRKLSTQYLLGDSLDKLATAKRGNVLFYKETTLDPGRYTIASVVYDALTAHSSVNTASVTVPQPTSNALQMSSLIVIKNAERLAHDQQTANPLHFGEVMLYPNLGEPLRKSVNKDLTLFVTIYPPKGEAQSPKLKLEIARNGRAVGQFTYNLPAADQTGRIQYVAAIPLDKLQPGEYDVNVTVEDGQHRATQSDTVRVTP